MFFQMRRLETLLLIIVHEGGWDVLARKCTVPSQYFYAVLSTVPLLLTMTIQGQILIMILTQLHFPV